MINFGLALFKARPNPSSDRHHCQATNRLGAGVPQAILVMAHLSAALDLCMTHRDRHLDRSGGKVVLKWNLRPAAEVRNDFRGGHAPEPAAFFGRSPGRQTKHNARRIKVARAGSIDNGSCSRGAYRNDTSAGGDYGTQRSAGDSGKPDLGSNAGHGVLPDFGLKQGLQLHLVGEKDIDMIFNKIEKRLPMSFDAKGI